MIKKVITLRNIGRFKKLDALGDVELKRYTLMVAENGRGKTTLCAILRSLKLNDPAYILGRATLGSPDAPAARILVDDATHVFAAGAWDSPLRDIAIFDSTFVSENVYSGDAVEIGHRRNLYRVIVGKEGVIPARQIDALDAESRQKAAEIRDKTAFIQAQLPRGSRVETFLDLAPDVAIDDKIAAKTTELEAVRQADQIRIRAALTPLTLLLLPDDHVALLGKTLEDVAADAETRVSAHIASHNMRERGEAWITHGLGYVTNPTCPFCAQDLAPAEDLLAAYRAHFSQAYAELRADVGRMRTAVDTTLGDRQVAAFEASIERNAAGVDFWSRFVEIAPPAAPAGAGDVLRAVRQTALALLDRKAAAPLEALTPDGAFHAARDAANALQASVQTYNDAVTRANDLIAQRKTAMGVADVRTVETELAQLTLVKKRFEPEVSAACNDHRELVAAKTTIENKKVQVRATLDAYTQQVIGRYESTINRFLSEFNAGFSITQTRHAYPGGKATSSYQILINGTAVDLGGANTPLQTPSFCNTLSSGDRSTLALTFFLAQLEHDPDRTSKIVVFDDPFNSQDSFRKDHTARKIRDYGEKCEQVIVLSHDPGFLGRVWERLDDHLADRKTLELKRIGLHNTSIIAWDIEAALQTAYSADRRILTDFYHDNKGNPRTVVQKIRPVLETHTKRLSAGVLRDTDTLGVITGKIRDEGDEHPLFPVCDDLDELNIYTRRYMHGENVNAGVEPITDGELHGYVGKTLEITGGC